MKLQDLMMLYGVTLGARHTKRQRYLFATQMKEALTEHGWDYEVQTNPKGKTARRVENIVVGDPSRAKTVFVAPYDTPTKATRPFHYYPFNPEKTMGEERRDMTVKTVLGLLIAILAVPLISLAMARKGTWYFLLLGAALFLFLGYRVMRGRANEVNFNRASAAVAVCMKLVEALKDKKNSVSFVFCDQAATSYEGYRVLGMELPQNANVVVLDAVAYGETLVLAHGPLANLRARKLLEKLPEGTRERTYGEEQLERNLLSFFPGGMVLTSGKIEGGELLVENTHSSGDHKLDLPRLEQIEKALEDFVRD